MCYYDESCFKSCLCGKVHYSAKKATFNNVVFSFWRIASSRGEALPIFRTSRAIPPHLPVSEMGDAPLGRGGRGKMPNCPPRVGSLRAGLRLSANYVASQ